MDTSVISTLSSGLDFGSARLEALANNLSNVNTPGYKRKDVSFSSLLDSVSGDSDGTAMERSDPRDLSPDSSSPTPDVVTDNNGSMRADGNNVDIDAESARLAAAQIYYQGTAQLLQNQFSNLKYVIGGG
jgi:flagellar basal-body rod protein FlgB